MPDMTFNNITGASLHLARCVPLTPLRPEKKTARIEIAGRDGVVDFDNDSYRPVVIPVDCLMANATSESELAGWLADIAVWLSGSGDLLFDGDTTKQWKNAKAIQGVDMLRPPLTRQFIVVFECDPYAEDVTETTGADIDDPADFGSDVIFYPEINITMTGAATYAQVALASTGELVRIETTLANADEIVINMATGKATLNGSNVTDKVTIGSLFFGVPPGTQDVVVTTDGTCTATMDYRKRYLYA